MAAQPDEVIVRLKAEVIPEKDDGGWVVTVIIIIVLASIFFAGAFFGYYLWDLGHGG